MAVLQKFFGGIQFAVFAGVEKWDVGVRALVAEIDFAIVEGLGINVDADGAPVEFRQVHDFMDRLDGIHIGGMRSVEIVGIGGDDFARAVGGVAPVYAVVLNAKPADGRGHPTVLTAMVVNAAVLADIPADGHALKEIIPEN